MRPPCTAKVSFAGAFSTQVQYTLVPRLYNPIVPGLPSLSFSGAAGTSSSVNERGVKLYVFRVSMPFATIVAISAGRNGSSLIHGFFVAATRGPASFGRRMLLSRLG